MGITKRPESGLYQLNEYVRINGKLTRIRKSLGTSEYAQALEIARDILRDYERCGQAGGPLAQEYIDRYLRWHATTYPAGHTAVKNSLTRFTRWLQTEHVSTLAQVSPVVLEKYRASLIARNLQHSTINAYFIHVRAALNKAIEWDVLEKANPANKVKSFRVFRVDDSLNDDEVGGVMEAAAYISAHPHYASLADPDWERYLIVLFNCGLRKFEGSLLKKTAVRDGALHILGKGDRWRSVPMNEPAEKAVAESRVPNSPWVFDFPARHTENTFERVVEKTRKLSGVERFHLHLTRHYFASKLEEAGVSPRVIQQLLGHSSLRTTDTYLHGRLENAKAEAVSKICVTGGLGHSL